MNNGTMAGHTYAGRIRQAMAYQRVSIRNLERLCDFSYEHVRKVVGGHPVASRTCNAAICKVLGLDEPELWQLAVREKRAHRLGSLGIEMNSTADAALTDLWPLLSIEEQGILRRIADGWLAGRPQ